MDDFQVKFPDPKDRLTPKQIKSFFSRLRKKIKDSLNEEQLRRLIDEKVKEGIKANIEDNDCQNQQTPPNLRTKSKSVSRTIFKPDLGTGMDLDSVSDDMDIDDVADNRSNRSRSYSTER